jgi:DMSO reductase family type II enzyme chaperone
MLGSEGLSSTSIPSSDTLRRNCAQNRQMIYRILASLFLYPTEERVADLLTAGQELLGLSDYWGEMELSDLGPLLGLLRALGEQVTASTQELEEQYVALFSAKPKAPPYESVYTDPEGFQRGWIAVKLERDYADAGLALSDTIKEQPDHIAVEMEFMSHLCQIEAQGETAELICAVREKQRRFLEVHLGKWLFEFSGRVREQARESFYAQVAEVAEAFVKREMDSADSPRL